MLLPDNQPPRFLEKIKFITNQSQRSKNGANPREDVANVPSRARIGKAKPSENQRNADPGKDDDLMNEFKGHGLVGVLALGVGVVPDRVANASHLGIPQGEKNHAG